MKRVKAEQVLIRPQEAYKTGALQACRARQHVNEEKEAELNLQSGIYSGRHQRVWTQSSSGQVVYPVPRLPFLH